jgi:hypothetical protein
VVAQSFTNNTFQALKPQQILPLADVIPRPAFQPEPNHVYLVNITDGNPDPAGRQILRIVKLLIVHWIPPAKYTGEPRVGIRCDILLDNQDAVSTVLLDLISGREEVWTIV